LNDVPEEASILFESAAVFYQDSFSLIQLILIGSSVLQFALQLFADPLLQETTDQGNLRETYQLSCRI
jgi:hypothetical protein